MSKKTLQLIQQYKRILKEQSEGIPSDNEFDSSNGQDVTNVVEPTPEETVPMTSEGENAYIENLIDAALFSPSSEDAKTLTDLQSQMQMKKFTNARDEILPTILNIIKPRTEEKDIRGSLDQVDTNQ